MKQILVYGDSLTWGIIPDTRQRLNFHDRWPGVLETHLNKKDRVRVIENCLNGRRTAWEDPFKPGRNGLDGIQQVIEMHSPLKLVIILLGTNDFQSMHPHTAWHAASGIEALVKAVHRAPIEPGMPVPAVLVVVPPLIQQPRGLIADKFQDAEHKCLGLGKRYNEICNRLECDFFDSNTVIRPSSVDGIHLDKTDHHALGQVLAKEVAAIIGR